jgi:hypothetical protein
MAGRGGALAQVRALYSRAIRLTIRLPFIATRFTDERCSEESGMCRAAKGRVEAKKTRSANKEG